MGWKIFFSFAFFILVLILLLFYWFIPTGTIKFGSKTSNYNFSLSNQTTDMQFYENMRFPDSKISYNIENCPLQKKDDMEAAFEIIENKTILNFYLVSSEEEISVTCDSKNKIEEGLFIAGEGGPTNITKAGKFNVILHGKVLLIKESECERPNIALHELLHALGFNHSDNPNNIMYPVMKCEQTISQDIIQLINELYSIQSYPDLSFENVSAIMHGKYLNANMSIRNEGLAASEKAKVIIYADEKIVKEIDLGSLEIGYGKQIFIENAWVPKISIEKLSFVIDYNFNELEKENNKIILEIIES